MAITVEADYEGGVLKLNEPLPISEHETVRVTIQRHGDWVRETAGILDWTGSAELAEQFATDVDLVSPPVPEKP